MILMSLLAGKQWGHRQNRLMDTGKWEEGDGELRGESNMETYITICKIDSQWEFAVMTQTGALYQPRGVGWGGRWEGGSKRFKREGT